MPVIINGTTGVSGVDGSAGTPAVQGSDSNTGVFFPAADVIAFTTNGTEDARFDASGNFGIGTSSPAYKLDVSGVARVTSSITTNSDLQVNPSGYNLYLRNIGGINRIDSYNSPITATVPLQLNASLMTFLIADSEKARIDSSGNFMLGLTGVSATNAKSWFFDVQQGYQSINHSTANTSGNFYSGFAYNGSYIGSITQSGTTAVLYNVTSDQRLKENIADADDASDLIDTMQVRKYDWKADGTHQRYGFVAQELAKVTPEAVYQPEDPEQMMAVDYSKLVPMLVKEIQSLRKRLAALEAK